MGKVCTRCGTTFRAKYPNSKLCLACWRLRERMFENYELMLKRLDAAPEPIPADMLRTLIYLCHPDKHDGSQTANKATRWLLEQRGR